MTGRRERLRTAAMLAREFHTPISEVYGMSARDVATLVGIVRDENQRRSRR